MGPIAPQHCKTPKVEESPPSDAAKAGHPTSFSGLLQGQGWRKLWKQQQHNLGVVRVRARAGRTGYARTQGSARNNNGKQTQRFRGGHSGGIHIPPGRPLPYTVQMGYAPHWATGGHSTQFY